MFIMTDYLFGSIVGAGVMAILTIVNSYYERRIINKTLKDLEEKIDKLIKMKYIILMNQIMVLLPKKLPITCSTGLSQCIRK